MLLFFFFPFSSTFSNYSLLLDVCGHMLSFLFISGLFSVSQQFLFTQKPSKLWLGPGGPGGFVKGLSTVAPSLKGNKLSHPATTQS